MDELGKRIVRDQAQIRELRHAAERKRVQAAAMNKQADEIERLLELAVQSAAMDRR